MVEYLPDIREVLGWRANLNLVQTHDPLEASGSQVLGL